MGVGENTNDVRTNIIEMLIRLHEKFEDQDVLTELQYEKYMLTFIPGIGLEIIGGCDVIKVTETAYDAVQLGQGIVSYAHLPYYWLQNILEVKS
ncbi:hypothetical protein AM501_05290 [Aneurinibacillus migulanus]|uniref:hypothetical protein n=1 Tax=Aneurinibacillus migulanus TaxID=47500 RepID=UPI0005B9C305|nr:hypothetical protein [Aneurinibacillus migulanus]KIV58577.1 hypothetical protein TS64_04325 [Aneurinibacillus migulanus]KPD09251.1 hypothetical protein AM501_05290 [Aneurinibacillus migulanus]